MISKTQRAKLGEAPIHPVDRVMNATEKLVKKHVELIDGLDSLESSVSHAIDQLRNLASRGADKATVHELRHRADAVRHALADAIKLSTEVSR
mgnify:CR=1 FL=1|tara:strand:+ start:21063 stop:21341 length:279 start_codon:yes stop_codon:yes gene_type:complete